MAKWLWGKVYFHDVFAGYLRQEPGERFRFTYDPSYLSDGKPPIAHTLPLQEHPHDSEYGLHPFFDNLVAEGWLAQAQARVLGKHTPSRFELLLAFGVDCAGAVSIVDPDPAPRLDTYADPSDPKSLAILKGRASLSGVQPKLMLVHDQKSFRPTQMGEVSTHIAKFQTNALPDILENEWLTTLACKALLPSESFPHISFSSIKELGGSTLIIDRFDRTPQKKRVHFEEFSQLLGIPSEHKYEAAYRDMAEFIYANPTSIPGENFRLFQRILAGILVGNTDMHLKNFAMWHTADGLRLTPVYDQVASALYHPRYQEMALSISGAANLPVGSLKSKAISALGREFQLTDRVIEMTVTNLQSHLSDAKDAISTSPHGSQLLKNKLIHFMEKRWNGTFASIGKHLSRKQSLAAKAKS